MEERGITEEHPESIWETSGCMGEAFRRCLGDSARIWESFGDIWELLGDLGGLAGLGSLNACQFAAVSVFSSKVLKRVEETKKPRNQEH